MKLTKNNTHGGSHSIVNGTQKASEGKNELNQVKLQRLAELLQIAAIAGK